MTLSLQKLSPKAIIISLINLFVEFRNRHRTLLGLVFSEFLLQMFKNEASFLTLQNQGQKLLYCLAGITYI